MAFSFGPADLYTVVFPEERVPPAVIAAVVEAIGTKVITLLDAVVVRHTGVGEVTVLELENFGGEVDLTVLEVSNGGLIAEEDIQEIVPSVPVGSTALMFLFENTWARNIASAVISSEAVVLDAERIPATVVNEIAEVLASLEEETA